MLRAVSPQDANQLAEIYNYYILNTTVSFEEQPISIQDMEKRIFEKITKLPWIVYEKESRILGYAYASPWKPRAAYRQSAESSVYLNPDYQGQGIGSMLYQELLQLLKKMNFHAIMAGIALPNSGSVALHEKFGFEKVAHFKEIGYKFGEYIDVAYWELLISRM